MNQPETRPAEEQGDSPPVYQFEDLRLKAGDRLQVQLPTSVSEERQIVRLIGFLEKQCLLITAPTGVIRLKPLREGDYVVVRAFLGQGAFGFAAYVDKIVRSPFEYVHLSWPKEFQGLMVRKAPRVKTGLAAKVKAPSGEVDAQVVNLSATGMMLRSTVELGARDQEISVTLPLDLYDVKTEITLNCRIKTVGTAKVDEADMHQSGVEFLKLQPNETLILQSVVHHELAKNPYSVV
ncbi:MAG TPA: flagellar brake protein, partial [Burkholderiales bacterium]|nr:flagellar brake protein [Burkholderiales bacterium]